MSIPSLTEIQSEMERREQPGALPALGSDGCVQLDESPERLAHVVAILVEAGVVRSVDDLVRKSIELETTGRVADDAEQENANCDRLDAGEGDAP